MTGDSLFLTGHEWFQIRKEKRKESLMASGKQIQLVYSEKT